MVSTLNELSQLNQSGFGQPQPRHGLNLLYWFAQDYIRLQKWENCLQVYSSKRKLWLSQVRKQNWRWWWSPLAQSESPVLWGGQPELSKSRELPDYVRANYSHSNPDSNKDRIIVRQDADGNFNRVYVTEHSDPKQFDSSKTYRVSQGLLQFIKSMGQVQDLQKIANTQVPDVMFTEQSTEVMEPKGNSCWCTIL